MLQGGKKGLYAFGEIGDVVMITYTVIARNVVTKQSIMFLDCFAGSQ